MRGTLTAIGIAVALILVYICSCTFWPFRPCWCCRGSGKHHRGDGKVFKDCRWCKGSGRRLRIGRRIWNHGQRRRAAAR